MIHVYENTSGFRVVSGAHKAAAEHRNLQPRTYATATDAFKIETHPRIRAALVEMGASVEEAHTHMMVRGDRAVKPWKGHKAVSVPGDSRVFMTYGEYIEACAATASVAS